MPHLRWGAAEWQIWVKSYGEVPLRHAKDTSPNLDWQRLNLHCMFEHCIKTMPQVPLDDPRKCPWFGNRCPGGAAKVSSC